MTSSQAAFETATGQEGLLAGVAALERFQITIRTMSGKENILDMAIKHLNSLWPFKMSAFFLPNELMEFLPATALNGVAGKVLTAEVEAAIDSGTFGWVMKHVRPACFKSGRDGERLILGALRTRHRLIGMFVALVDNEVERQRESCSPFLAIYLSSVADALLSEQLTRELRDHNNHLDEMVRQRTSQLEDAKEAAEVASRSKDMFLATISHELRTPLNGILGVSQNLVSSGTLAPATREQLDVIHSSADRLLSIINDLLDLALPDISRTDLCWGDVNIRDLLRDLAPRIQPKAEEKRLTVQFTVAAGVPDAIQVDRKRLQQLLMNLLNNAVKFTDQGTVALRVSRLGRRVRFLIEDTGRGIAPERMPTLFRPFQQMEASLRRGEGGGWGLAISRNIAMAMRTEIHVTSELGKGSVFWFELEAPDTDSGRGECVFDLSPQAREKLDIPAEKLQRFRKLVGEGDILALQEELEAWQSSLPAPNPAAEKLLELATGFQMKALRKALEMIE
jgi:signal transduction histidine kinase